MTGLDGVRVVFILSCCRFRHSLMTWGEKFSASEIDDAFGEFKIDGGMIDGAHLKSIMVAKKEGEE